MPALVLQVTLMAFLLLGAKSSQALDLSRYYSLVDIDTFLQKIAHAHSDFVEIQTLGYSTLGNPIYILRVGHPQDDALTKVYINATHHGDEKGSLMAALGLADFLINTQRDPSYFDIWDNFAIYIQPIVNPDGYANNSRYDSRGRDLNRDYPYPGRSLDQSFQIKETTLVETFLAQNNVRGTISIHSGMEAVLWPWCHSKSSLPESDQFERLARRSADAMGFVYYRQSNHDYPSQGEYIDYAYWKYRSFAVTFEVSLETTPSLGTLPGLIAKTTRGTLAYLRELKKLIQETQS